MKKTIINIFIIFILFSDIIFSNINLPEYFRWWDVLLEVILLGLFTKKFFTEVKNKGEYDRKFIVCYILLLAIIIIGLIGDIIFGYYNSCFAIVKDILSFLKFPLTFLLLKDLEIDGKFSDCLDKRFYKVLIGIVILIFALGIISLFFNIGLSLDEYRHGIRPYTFLFSHPTFLVISMVFILALFEYKKDIVKHMVIYEILVALIVLLTMRTKAIAFLAVFFLIKFFGKYLLKYKKIAIALIGIALIATTYSKLALYASFSSSTREVLYKGSVTLAGKCFPIGSGFATFASHISGQYGSKVYEFINVDYVFKTGYLAQLGDVGFPYYLGQFGILGCTFIVLLAKRIGNICLKNKKNRLATILLLLYILIGLTTESTLLNFGSEVAIILAIISAKNEKKEE